MKKQNRSPSSFNLSFLDIMFCGFGAVVLLVLIINSHIVTDTREKFKDLSAEVAQVEKEITATELYKRNLQQLTSDKEEETKTVKSKLAEITKQVEEVQKKEQLSKSQSLALKKHIDQLQNDLKKAEKKKWKEKQQLDVALNQSGNKVRKYEGQGNRQYLTGLKLGGKRVLILLDSSASMLDETIVNVIVKRNMSDAVKRSARKWTQAVNTVRWLVANLPVSSKVMIVSFNTKPQSLASQQSLQWIKTTDKAGLNSLIKNLSHLIPQNGTSLYKAFATIKKISGRPDNVILITDGLPTQGRIKPQTSKVTPPERVKLAQQAIQIIPKNIPVNTILLPMEGDPMAAVIYWKLAIDTKGSFMTPSRDWP